CCPSLGTSVRCARPRTAPETISSVSDPEPQPAVSDGASPDRPAKSGCRGKRRSAGTGRAAQYWMIVSSPDNFKKTREHGFSIQGLKSRHRRRVESMRPGDRMLYYVTGR